MLIYILCLFLYPQTLYQQQMDKLRFYRFHQTILLFLNIFHLIYPLPKTLLSEVIHNIFYS